ncbi:MAG: TetR/AcrR family transcriptional regulator [Leucobacter sp.]
MTMRDEQKRETASKVLAEADRLFRVRGFAETTVREIATSCGVSTGTVMAVGDKNALLVACFDQRIRKIHEARSVPQGRSSPVPLAEQIVSLLTPFLELFTEHPLLARAYGAILVSGRHESVVFTDLAKLLIGEIAGLLRSAGSPQRDGDGDVSERRAASLAESIYFAYIGRLFTWLPADHGDATALQNSLHRIVSAVCEAEGVRS